MSKGLIWQALGKGIADAGATVGNVMLKQQMMEEESRRELAKEERADKRFNDRKDAETAKEEAKTEARAKLVRDSYPEAEDMPVKRDAKGMLSFNKQFSVDTSESPEDQAAQAVNLSRDMTPQELEGIRNLPPEARKVYEESGILDKQLDPRMQRHADAAEAAAGRGADSKTMDYFEDAKKKALEVIREENKVGIAATQEAGKDKRAELNRSADIALSNQKHTQTMAAISARQSSGSDGRSDKPPKPGEMSDVQKAKDKAYLDEIKDARDALQGVMDPKLKPDAELRLRNALAARNSFLTNIESTKSSDSKPAGGQSGTPKAPPKVNEVVGGYRFKGGDPSKQTNWEKAK